MPEEFHKNDYKFKEDLRKFANQNFFGRFLKPFLKDAYKVLERHIPQPRDFLLRMMGDDVMACEIGVWEGEFSERIFRIAKPKKLYLVDPWEKIEGREEQKYSQEFQEQRYEKAKKLLSLGLNSGRIEIIRKKSDIAVNDFSDEYFDFVYIDGDHSYKQVKSDLVHFYPKVRFGKFLCGDDYHLEGVKRAVDEFVQETPPRSFFIKNRQFIFQK